MIKKFNKYLSYKNNSLYLDETSFESIKKKYSTPLYCYSLSEIYDNFIELKKSFTKIKPMICYAVKANNHNQILSLLSKSGCGSDVVSKGELKKSIDNGVTPDKIVFSGVGKTKDEIKYALKKKIKQLNVESEEELEEIVEIAKVAKKKVNICIRVNPDVDPRTHYKISTGRSEDKFGIPNSRVIKLFEKYKNNDYLSIVGLSIHIGSQIKNLRPFEIAFKKIKKQIISLRELGFEITVLDLGGGIGIRYLENDRIINIKEYCLLVEKLFSNMKLEIIIEPGRSLVGSSGILLSSVIRKKSGEKKDFIIIDAGMNNLIRPAMYNAKHEILPVKRKNLKKKKYDFVGPICESADIFSKQNISQALKKDDLIAICSVGAYGACMSSNYNLRGDIKEIFIKKNEIIDE